MKDEKEMTARITVKMSEALKEKLKRKCEKSGVDMSAYIRMLIEKRLSPAAGQCYECLGKLEDALNHDDVGFELYHFLAEKYKEQGEK